MVTAITDTGKKAKSTEKEYILMPTEILITELSSRVKSKDRAPINGMKVKNMKESGAKILCTALANSLSLMATFNKDHLLITNSVAKIDDNKMIFQLLKFQEYQQEERKCIV